MAWGMVAMKLHGMRGSIRRMEEMEGALDVGAKARHEGMDDPVLHARGHPS